MNDRVPVYFFNPGQRIPSYARGGLHEHARELARQGRNGDNMVVHMSKDEFNAFRSKYGDPTINPKTGLPEYWSLRDFIAPAASIIAPLALSSAFPTAAADLASYFGGAPGLETAISGLGGAGVGALASKVMGGNALLGAGLGGLMGAALPNTDAITAGVKGLFTAPTVAPVGAGSGFTVQPPGTINFGAIPEVLPASTDGISIGGAMPLPVAEVSPIVTPVPVDTGGYTLGGAQLYPPETIRQPLGAALGISPSTTPIAQAAAKKSLWDQWKWPALIGGGLMAAQYANQPKAVPKTGSPIVPYSRSRNEPLQNITLARNYQAPANLGTFGQRARGPNERFFNDQFITAARGGEVDGGGPLSMMSAMHDGPGYVGSKEPNGDGRSDGVEARLSNKEYVVDATTMSLLGNGDPDAGARKMDDMRKQIWKRAGKTMAKGKFPPDSKKSPLSYMSGGG